MFRDPDKLCDRIAGPVPHHTAKLPSQDVEEDGDEEGTEAARNVMTGMKDDGEGEAEEEGLHPQDIDAYWLQRRIAK